MRVIALEEHFLTEAIARESARHPDRLMPRMVGPLRDKLLDLGEGRLAAMDAAGVDVQVLSLVVHDLEPADEPALARDANDRLAEAVARHPTRVSRAVMLSFWGGETRCEMPSARGPARRMVTCLSPYALTTPRGPTLTLGPVPTPPPTTG